MKETILAVFGTVGGILAAFFGGWTAALVALLFFMGIDFVMGLIVAAAFKNSPKTESGGLNSAVSFKGLLKKVGMLLIVGAAYQVDNVAGTTFVKDAVVIAFIGNELISMTENAGLMGIPMPEKLKNAIDMLQKNGEENK